MQGCQAHFEAVQRYLDDRGIEYEVRPRLVRGLDYYTRTTFEIVHGSLGAQNSVLGGGRYDGLAEASRLEGAGPGIGFSIGEDRLVMSVEEQHRQHSTRSSCSSRRWAKPRFRHAGLLAREIRAKGAVVEVAPDGQAEEVPRDLPTRSGREHTLIVGDNEIAAGTYALKNMKSGEQTTVSHDDLLNRF